MCLNVACCPHESILDGSWALGWDHSLAVLVEKKETARKVSNTNINTHCL